MQQYIGVILSKSQSRYSADAVLIPDTLHLPFDFLRDILRENCIAGMQFHLIVNDLKCQPKFLHCKGSNSVSVKTKAALISAAAETNIWPFCFMNLVQIHFDASGRNLSISWAPESCYVFRIQYLA